MLTARRSERTLRSGTATLIWLARPPSWAVTAPAATHDIRVVTAASLRRRRYGLAVSAPATGLTATIASVV